MRAGNLFTLFIQHGIPNANKVLDTVLLQKCLWKEGRRVVRRGVGKEAGVRSCREGRGRKRGLEGRGAQGRGMNLLLSEAPVPGTMLDTVIETKGLISRQKKILLAVSLEMIHFHKKF